MSDKQILISWLMCCEAMEKEIALVLVTQLKEAKDYPEIAKQIEMHLKQTRVHRERMENCLKELGEKPNLGKDAVGVIMGLSKSLISNFSFDKVIRNAIIDSGVEHYEMAAYKAVSEVAKATDYPEIVEVCEEIYKEEEDMAIWLEKNLTSSVQKFLEKTK